jgi:uncharacterized membrane protein
MCFEIEQTKVDVDTSMGIDAGLASMIAYFFGWISGLIFAFVEKTNNYVIFNAWQSVFMSIVFTVFWIICIVIDQIIIASTTNYRTAIMTLIAVIIILICEVFLMYRAYVGVRLGEITIMPCVGNFAYNLSYGKAGGVRASKAEGKAESGRAPADVEAPSQ